MRAPAQFDGYCRISDQAPLLAAVAADHPGDWGRKRCECVAELICTTCPSRPWGGRCPLAQMILHEIWRELAGKSYENISSHSQHALK